MPCCDSVESNSSPKHKLAEQAYKTVTYKFGHVSMSMSITPTRAHPVRTYPALAPYGHSPGLGRDTPSWPSSATLSEGALVCRRYAIISSEKTETA